MVRSEKTKQAFIKYMEDNPGERFWQSIRNFSGYSFIIASNGLPDRPDQADTFHWEELKEPKERKENK